MFPKNKLTENFLLLLIYSVTKLTPSFFIFLQIPEAEAAVLSLSINQDATYMAAINNQV